MQRVASVLISVTLALEPVAGRSPLPRDTGLQTVQEEKDLGVTISTDLKHTKHCKSACKKANTMLGFIARNFEYKTPRVMLTLYNSRVRPHLE